MKVYDINISEFRESNDDDVLKGINCEAAIGYLFEQTKLLHAYTLKIGQGKLSVMDAPHLPEEIT
jgi:hypothetical protein